MESCGELVLKLMGTMIKLPCFLNYNIKIRVNLYIVI